MTDIVDGNVYLPSAYKRNIPRLLKKFQKIFDDRSILICPLMFGGSNDFDLYEEYIDKEDCTLPPYVRCDLEASDEIVYREHRKIKTPVEEVQEKLEYRREEGEDIRDMIVFDNVLRSGKTLIGGHVYGLENSDDLGIERVWGMSSYDLLGIAVFSVFKCYDEWLGPVKFMKDGAPNHDIPLKSLPNTYEMLKERDLLEKIGTDEYDTEIEKSERNPGLKDIEDKDASTILRDAFKMFQKKR